MPAKLTPGNLRAYLTKNPKKKFNSDNMNNWDNYCPISCMMRAAGDTNPSTDADFYRSNQQTINMPNWATEFVYGVDMLPSPFLGEDALKVLDRIVKPKTFKSKNKKKAVSQPKESQWLTGKDPTSSCRWCKQGRGHSRTIHNKALELGDNPVPAYTVDPIIPTNVIRAKVLA